MNEKKRLKRKKGSLGVNSVDKSEQQD